MTSATVVPAIGDGFLLDTMIASAAWDEGHAQHHNVRARLGALGVAPVFISVVTFAEIEYGLKVSPLADVSRQSIVRANMNAYELRIIDHNAGDSYSEIRAAIFRKYSPADARGRLTSKRPESLVDRTTGLALGIQENDLWIVATAITYNLIFVTSDHKGGMSRIIAEANYLKRTRFWW